jgi:hypothetical protein
MFKLIDKTYMACLWLGLAAAAVVLGAVAWIVEEKGEKENRRG